MLTKKVPLSFVPGCKWASLREVCGSDEQAVTGTSTTDAINLLDRLLVDVPEANIHPGEAKLLTAADRDRLLATIYVLSYGPQIDSTVRCNNCEVLFDIDFSLEELVKHLYIDTNESKAEKDTDGSFRLPDGRRFRLPTGEDECAIWELSLEQAEYVLQKRCVLEGDSTEDPQLLQQVMKELAPVIDLDMKARCPECGYQQQFHFDIQYYLLTAFRKEQEQLIQEVHRLATAYGWSLSEILGLPRRLRRAYVEFVESGFGSR